MFAARINGKIIRGKGKHVFYFAIQYGKWVLTTLLSNYMALCDVNINTMRGNWNIIWFMNKRKSFRLPISVNSLYVDGNTRLFEELQNHSISFENSLTNTKVCFIAAWILRMVWQQSNTSISFVIQIILWSLYYFGKYAILEPAVNF